MWNWTPKKGKAYLGQFTHTCKLKLKVGNESHKILSFYTLNQPNPQSRWISKTHKFINKMLLYLYKIDFFPCCMKFLSRNNIGKNTLWLCPQTLECLWITWGSCYNADFDSLDLVISPEILHFLQDLRWWRCC